MKCLRIRLARATSSEQTLDLDNFLTAKEQFNKGLSGHSLILSVCLSVTKVEILLLNIPQPIRAQFETN